MELIWFLSPVPRAVARCCSWILAKWTSLYREISARTKSMVLCKVVNSFLLVTSLETCVGNMSTNMARKCESIRPAPYLSLVICHSPIRVRSCVGPGHFGKSWRRRIPLRRTSSAPPSLSR